MAKGQLGLDCRCPPPAGGDRQLRPRPPLPNNPAGPKDTGQRRGPSGADEIERDLLALKAWPRIRDLRLRNGR